MGLTDVVALGVDYTQPLIRSSGWVTIGSLLVSTLIDDKDAIHGDLINFNGIYIGQKERIKISEIKLRQSAATLGSGEALVLNEMLLVLFNTDAFNPTGGSQISFPSGYDEDDILCVIKIPATAWITYKDGYAEAEIQPDYIVEGDIADANLGVNIHGILLLKVAGTLPAAAVMKIKMNTELLGNADDD